MAAAWIIARSEWRLRGRALVLLALIGWITTTMVIAPLAASRRSGTSFERLLEATRTPNVQGWSDRPVDPERFAQLADVPGVRAGGLGAMFAVAPADTDLVPGVNVIGMAVSTPIRGGLMTGIPIDGRHPRPDEVGEIAVNEEFRRVTGLGAGDAVELVSLTDEQMEEAENTGETPGAPRGPRMPVRITGVVRVAEDISDAPEPALMLTSAFAARYESEIANLSGIVGLRIDTDRLDHVRRAARRLLPPGVTLEPTEDFSARIADGIEVQRVALLVFAGVVAAAGLLVIAQNLRRLVAVAAENRSTLTAMGASRHLSMFSGALMLAPVVAFAVAGGCAASIAVAPMMVSGLARQAEPDPGMWIDPAALAVGALWGTAALVGLAYAIHAIGIAGHAGAPKVSAADRLTRRLGLGAGPATGLRFALDSGRAIGGVPTRSAIGGAAIGVAGVVATLVLVASLTQLLERPADWGATFDVVLDAPESLDAAAAAAEEIAGIEGVRAVAIRTADDFATLEFREASLPVELGALRPVEGAVPFRIVDGNAPSQPGEIVVGAHVLAELGATVGDKVVVTTSDGDSVARIVGTVVSPAVDDVDRSVFMTPEGLDRAGADPTGRVVVASAEDGATPEELARRLRTAGYEDATPVPLPSSIDNLDELGALPGVLVAFLATLSVLAAASAMVLTVRRRRRDIAVLRTLGFVRRQVRQTVAWQAGALVLVATVVGLPLGFVAGRTAYAAIAEGVGFLVHVAVPVPALSLVVAGTALAGAAIAALLAPAAQRLAPADTLRAE